MGDKARSAAVCFAVCRPNDPHHLSIELEVDFGVGEKARLFPNLDRDRHLSFGCMRNIQRRFDRDGAGAKRHAVCAAEIGAANRCERLLQNILDCV